MYNNRGNTHRPNFSNQFSPVQRPNFPRPVFSPQGHSPQSGPWHGGFQNFYSPRENFSFNSPRYENRPQIGSSPRYSSPYNSPRYSSPYNSPQFKRPYPSPNQSYNSSPNTSYHSQDLHYNRRRHEPTLDAYINPSMLDDPWKNMEPVYLPRQTHAIN